MPLIKFWLRPMVCEMSFEEFQDGRHGSHLGYLNGRILAILNFCVTVMLPIKFWLNPTYGWGDVIWRISRWHPWWPSWLSEWYNFSNSESLCCSNTSNQVLAQSHLWFWKCPLKYFKMATMALWYGNTMILAILSLYKSPKPPFKFQLNLTYCLGLDVVWRISRWLPWWPS